MKDARSPAGPPARPATYGIAELADLGGVSRRTVRYYVQEELIPPPRGAGRGAHYGAEHLAALLEVKALQERGLPLVDIRRALGAGGSGPPPRAEGVALSVSRSAWTRLELAPGVELHVSSDVRVPPPGGLRELAEWCRRLFSDRSR
jgi:DNA-binding transcriptional MerR regulator